MSKTAAPQHDLIDLRSAARLLDLSERGVWNRARRGEIPSVKVGHSRLYARQALEAWAATHRPTAA